jgi:hypothetical protein
LAINGPFGTEKPEEVCIQKGKCFKDSAFFSDDDVKKVAKCYLDSYDRHLGASFFWTAHNEIEERWSYKQSWDLGWLNQTRTEQRVPKVKELNFLQA